MKKRIIIYLCLFVLLAGGLVYIGQRKQAPTGRAAGSGGYRTIKGMIERIDTSSVGDYLTIRLKEDTDKMYNCVLTEPDERDFMVTLITTAFLSGCRCRIFVLDRGGHAYKQIISIRLEKDDAITNDKIQEAIEKSGGSSTDTTASKTSDGKVLNAISMAKDDVMNTISLAKGDIINTVSLAKTDLMNTISHAKLVIKQEIVQGTGTKSILARDTISILRDTDEILRRQKEDHRIFSEYIRDYVRKGILRRLREICKKLKIRT